MKNLPKRIFRRENLVALFLVFAAAVSLFEIPKKLGLSDTQVILVFLGFLAIDSLIEKVGYFEEAEMRTRRIEQLVAPHPDMVLLQRRRALQPFADCIAPVRDVFVFAMSASNLVSQQSRVIEEALHEGKCFRFVLMTPNNPALTAAEQSSPTAAALETQVRWIEVSITLLRRLAKDRGKGKLELRLFNGVPTTSLVGYDIDEDHGLIQVEPHVYRHDPTDRPLFTLPVRKHSEWYDYYRGVIEDLWTGSTECQL